MSSSQVTEFWADLDSNGFDTADKPRVPSAVVKSSSPRLLIDTIRSVHERLGFDVVDDEDFYHLVAARLVEPTSKSLAKAPTTGVLRWNCSWPDDLDIPPTFLDVAHAARALPVK